MNEHRAAIMLKRAKSDLEVQERQVQELARSVLPAQIQVVIDAHNLGSGAVKILEVYSHSKLSPEEFAKRLQGIMSGRPASLTEH